MYFTQEAKIFNSSAIVKKEPLQGNNLNYISLHVKDALLEGLHVKNNSDTLLLYFGGNADDATQFPSFIPDLHVDMIMFNYRGYVKSTGSPSQDALFSDALKIYDTYALTYNQVIIVGRSLGTAVASYLSSQRKANLTIFITPFDSMESLAMANHPWLPVKILLKHPFYSKKYIASVKHSISIMEVDKDSVTPKVHLESFMQNIINLKEHYVFYNTTHGKVLEHPEFSKVFQKMIKDFI